VERRVYRRADRFAIDDAAAPCAMMRSER
jgi:hypothetical protein